jgi:hypothetical protein
VLGEGERLYVGKDLVVGGVLSLSSRSGLILLDNAGGNAAAVAERYELVFASITCSNCPS